MFSWRRRWLSSTMGVLLATVLVPLGTATIAHAAINGPKILNAEGGTLDSNGNAGHIVLGGFVHLNRNGGAKSLNITIAYNDSPVNSGYLLDSFVCNLTDPSDFTYSISKGVGTATLTVASDDTCFQTIDPSVTGNEAGKSISFEIYNAGGHVGMVSTGSTLFDGESDNLVNVAVSGEMNPSGIGNRQAQGKRLVLGEGGTVDVDDNYVGHMALAGRMSLKRQKPGETSETAKALDLMLTFEDTDSTNFSCHFIDPSDVSYTLKKGVGTLTLTVGPDDTCTQGNDPVSNVDNSISFNLYAAGAKGRLVSTASTLVDSNGDTLIPAVTADFSSPGGSR